MTEGVPHGAPDGRVLHFYGRISVASVEVITNLKSGDVITIRGAVTDFDQKIESMQFRHQGIAEACCGMVVGIRVQDYVRRNDRIYKLEDHV